MKLFEKEDLWLTHPFPSYSVLSTTCTLKLLSTDNQIVSLTSLIKWPILATKVFMFATFRFLRDYLTLGNFMHLIFHYNIKPTDTTYKNTKQIFWLFCNALVYLWLLDPFFVKLDSHLSWIF